MTYSCPRASIPTQPKLSSLFMVCCISVFPLGQPLLQEPLPCAPELLDGESITGGTAGSCA